jgi:hypothetical protein
MGVGFGTRPDDGQLIMMLIFSILSNGGPARRYHPKFNSWHLADRDQLRNWSRSIREEIDQIEYQGEQVYRTLVQNAMASRMLIDQLTPHQPKDNEEVNAHMKHLQAKLDATTVVDLTLDCDDEARGHEPDHRQSPHRDSASSLTPPEEHGRR